MTSLDDQNVELIRTGGRDGAEQVVASFYDCYPYEQRPPLLDYVEDPSFEATMRGQEVGFWSEPLLPERPSIWVVGCGPTQAVVTALRFPGADVVGSDLAPRSLELARASADELGLANLTVRHESLLDTGYRQEFDLIFCTGVLHHTADPADGLRRLSAALRPSGVLELMVYNRFHRLGTSALQKAVRLLRPVDPDHPDFAADMHVARQLLEAVPEDGWTAQFLQGWRSDANSADALINPLEHSYTVGSLAELVEEASCGLRLAAPTQNWFDVGRGTISWDLTFDDPWVSARYEAFADPERWQLLNLLRFEHSPLLWFYLQPTDAPRPIPTQREICDSFLATAFRPSSTAQRQVVLGPDGRYLRSADATPLPDEPAAKPFDRLVSLADGRRPMAELFDALALPTDLATVNLARLSLTTALNPYLVAAG